MTSLPSQTVPQLGYPVITGSQYSGLSHCQARSPDVAAYTFAY